MPAPADLGLELISVPTGSDLELDLSLTSVSEGVYVSGNVHGSLSGECGRCLNEISEPFDVHIAELFAYADSTTEETTDEDEVGRMQGDLLDLARLDDVIGEVQSQVRSLARQRKRAERHAELRARRFTVEIALAADWAAAGPFGSGRISLMAASAANCWRRSIVVWIRSPPVKRRSRRSREVRPKRGSSRIHCFTSSTKWPAT